MIFISILLETSKLAASSPVTHASVCSLEDLKARLRDSCSEIRIPSHLQELERTRKSHQKLCNCKIFQRFYGIGRSYSDTSLDATKPNYYFRVKRDQVQVICCTPKLISIYGHRCIDLYSC